MKFRVITFIANGDTLHGYFFYAAANDFDCGHIFGMKELTLPKAIAKMKELGTDANKMNIAVYYL